MEAKLQENLENISAICRSYSDAYDIFFKAMENNEPLPHISMLREQDNRRANLVVELHHQVLILAEYYGKFKNEHTVTQNYCLEQLIFQPTQKTRSIDIDNVLMWCLYAFNEFE